MREKSIEKALRDAVKKAGGICLKLDPTFYTGIPDRLAILPGGRVVFIEVKAPGKKPSARQLLVHDTLRTLGHRVEVLDNTEDIKTVIA